MPSKYLIALHDEPTAICMAYRIRSEGHEVVPCDNLPDLLAKSQNGHTHCIMDANYGCENSTDVSPAEKVRATFKGRLLVLSHNPQTLSEAKSKGLDARDKMIFLDQIDDFLREYNIVLALHEPSIARTVSPMLESRGFQTSTAVNLEALRELAKNPKYKNYLMDPNFGSEASKDISPALEVRDILSARPDKDLVRLLAISGHISVTESCLANRIPAKTKPILIPELIAFFKRE